VIIHPLTPELRQRGVRTSPEFKLGKHWRINAQS
jgi:hypothetical protein